METKNEKGYCFLPPFLFWKKKIFFSPENQFPKYFFTSHPTSDSNQSFSTSLSSKPKSHVEESPVMILVTKTVFEAQTCPLPRPLSFDFDAFLTTKKIKND